MSLPRDILEEKIKSNNFEVKNLVTQIFINDLKKDIVNVMFRTRQNNGLKYQINVLLFKIDY